VAEVRRKIQELFNQEKPLAVVCYAACGADLIVLDVAESMGVERYALLPSKPDEFRKSSVVDRPGDWGDIYDRVLKTSRVKVLKLPEGQQGYLETNLRLSIKVKHWLAGIPHPRKLWSSGTRRPVVPTMSPAIFLARGKTT
jgi:hypothetical protein